MASETLSLLASVALAPIPVALLFLGSRSAAAMSLMLILASSFLAGQALAAYPASLAKKMAGAVLRYCPESTNLMIMSLRHDASVSKAIAFAAARRNAFSQELRRSVWSVVMGCHSGFEEALHSLGQKWSAFSHELSTSLDALVTASREPSQEGRRRALDRANSAMVSGAKRRIEDYALSLSAPSMVMFALGILLPLMVGSFLPMLSWNLWSLEPSDGVAGRASGDLTLQTVFLMNILFPAVALLVAMNAISRHPMDRAPSSNGGRVRPSEMVAAAASSLFAIVAVLTFLHDSARYPAAILGGVCPIALALIAAGRRGRVRHDGADKLEEALFRTGARMVEGENFEAALSHAGAGAPPDDYVRAVSFRTNVVGQGFVEASAADAQGFASASNAAEGMRIVRDAAYKDELGAGILAMDLSAYLKDLREIERSLKSRLRPTISMMRMTTYVLGPIVMGVTFAIYLSLASMTGAERSSSSAGAFMLLLGAFLAETDLVVGYFVWGIEGHKDRGALAGSIGLSLVSSEMVFVATAMLAA